MATSGKLPQHEGNLDNVQHSLKPISTKPKQPGSATPALPDSPFQPTSQSHVAALASSFVRHGSSDLALGNPAAALLTPVLQDSPYQPTSNKHVTDLARAYTGQAKSSSSSKPSTPQHTPVLPDSGSFQPGSRSHVAELIVQVTGRLQAQADGRGGSSPLAQQHQIKDLPFQLDSKSHVSGLVRTFKNTINSPAGDSSSTSRSVHGATPHNTPLARQAVGTFFTQQQQSIHAEQMQQMQQQQQPLSSEPGAAPGPQIIHLAYGKAAPFKAVPGASKVAAVARQLEGQNGDINTSTDGGSAACTKLHGTSNQDTDDVSKSGVLPNAATPAVSNDGMNPRLLLPSRKPQVVAARLSGITLEGAKVALERTASAEVAVSLASDSGQNINPLYGPSSEGVNLNESVGV